MNKTSVPSQTAVAPAVGTGIGGSFRQVRVAGL
jgi:hypothetical protein